MERLVVPFLLWASVEFVRRVTKKQLFGGEYVEVAQVITDVGGWAYPTGAILGRAFTNRPDALGKLLIKPGFDPLEYLPVAREFLQKRLGTKDVKAALESLRASGENYFLGSFMRTEWAKLEVPYPPSLSSDLGQLKRVSETKIEPRIALERAQAYLIEGIGLGVDWPEFVGWSWKSTYKKGRSSGETKLARLAGVDIPKEIEPYPLTEREVEVLEMVKTYVTEFRPDLVSVFGRS